MTKLILADGKPVCPLRDLTLAELAASLKLFRQEWAEAPPEHRDAIAADIAAVAVELGRRREGRA